LSSNISAAYQASNLQEGKDFRVVSEEVQSSDGVVKISTAKVLANSLITDNVYSGGIHQCLHAKLEKERVNGNEKTPFKFVVNAESEVVSSQTVKNFIDGYDRLNGYTGTYGYDVELSGYSKDIQSFQVPKHQAHNRTDLAPKFSKNKENHISEINKFVSKLSKNTKDRQPVLIVCENDEEARAMYEAISKERPNDPIQMVDSVKKDIDPETQLAGQKGMITIATPRMSRGTDISPDHSNGLCVVTAYADFRRVEGQIQGRAGRQAAKGVTVQILDESNLKNKLQTSTGQPVTSSGKKLLKRYHQHLEQENLNSVQGKQLEGDLRQSYVLLQQSKIKPQDKDIPEKVKELHKKWNKEFSDIWKDLSATHSGNTDKIKTELFTKIAGLEQKLDKVQKAKANRLILSYEKSLTKAQKPGAMLNSSDLTNAKKSVAVKASSLIRGAKSAGLEMAKADAKSYYLGFWQQNADKDILKSLSPQERASLQPNDTNFNTIKENIKVAITNYKNNKSNSLSEERKLAVDNFILKLDEAHSIENVYGMVKQAQSTEIISDIKNHSMFFSKKDLQYQEAFSNILDKIVVTGKVHSAKTSQQEIQDLVNQLPENNKVAKNLKPLIQLKCDTEEQYIMQLKLVKSSLSTNMKNYNSADKALAKDVINSIERVDLTTSKLATLTPKQKVVPIALSPSNNSRGR